MCVVCVCVSVCVCVCVCICVHVCGTFKFCDFSLIISCGLLCQCFTRDKMQLHIQDYHSWFKGLVGDWIDVAAVKCKDEIKRAVTSVDEVSCVLLLICVSIETSIILQVVTVTENVRFSQSALSAAACFKRVGDMYYTLLQLALDYCKYHTRHTGSYLYYYYVDCNILEQFTLAECIRTLRLYNKSC